MNDPMTPAQKECVRKVRGILNEQFIASVIVVRVTTPVKVGDAKEAEMRHSQVYWSGDPDTAISLLEIGKSVVKRDCYGV